MEYLPSVFAVPHISLENCFSRMRFFTVLDLIQPTLNLLFLDLSPNVVLIQSLFRVILLTMRGTETLASVYNFFPTLCCYFCSCCSCCNADFLQPFCSKKILRVTFKLCKDRENKKGNIKLTSTSAKIIIVYPVVRCILESWSCLDLHPYGDQKLCWCEKI